MPLESSAGTNVWPVERPALVLIQRTLSLGIKTLLNQDRGKGKRWTEEYQVEKGTDVLQSKAGKANIVFRKSYCWWHRRGVVFPVCVPCTSTSSCPPCLQLRWRDWLKAVLLLPLRPPCYSSSLCSNKCPVCHSSLLQRIRFILPLSHTLPPSFCPPPSLLSLLRSLALTREERLWETEYK